MVICDGYVLNPDGCVYTDVLSKKGIPLKKIYNAQIKPCDELESDWGDREQIIRKEPLEGSTFDALYDGDVQTFTVSECAEIKQGRAKYKKKRTKRRSSKKKRKSCKKKKKKKTRRKRR
jgi:hypothetical protein